MNAFKIFTIVGMFLFTLVCCKKEETSDPKQEIPPQQSITTISILTNSNSERLLATYEKSDVVGKMYYYGDKNTADSIIKGIVCVDKDGNHISAVLDDSLRPIYLYSKNSNNVYSDSVLSYTYLNNEIQVTVNKCNWLTGKLVALRQLTFKKQGNNYNHDSTFVFGRVADCNNVNCQIIKAGAQLAVSVFLMIAVSPGILVAGSATVGMQLAYGVGLYVYLSSNASASEQTQHVNYSEQIYANPVAQFNPISETHVPWNNFNDAYSTYQNSTDGILLVEVNNPACGPCVTMENSTYTDPTVVSQMKNDFILARYKHDFNSSLTEPAIYNYNGVMYNAKGLSNAITGNNFSGWPAVFFIKKNSNGTSRIKARYGIINPNEYISLLDSIKNIF